ncbi:hypothetical protein JMUB7465_06620 [Staphylococcus aureus]|uniref:Uncharacterized protein n=1 Tax=Staphylococcus aureus TaxID=1280 RepID=A0A641A760_STAAU|nr:hypothetical protein UC18_11955 [Staphylococcus aureus]AJP30788.1 hypothetical protein UC19_11925 [Staphylococcus aureus]ATN53370.1 hypothetical protein AB454_12250 [Staphylococcus aureus]AUU68289.1 hypothetical protein RL00_012615 [Staphylococcus aureus]AVG53634.1 hypothetical protein RL01_12675 [Staphylococcus aureus]
MENEKRTVDSIENQRFFLITVYYENYLKNDVKLEKIFLIDYFQNELNNPVIVFLIDDAVS